MRNIANPTNPSLLLFLCLLLVHPLAGCGAGGDDDDTSGDDDDTSGDDDDTSGDDDDTSGDDDDSAGDDDDSAGDDDDSAADLCSGSSESGAHRACVSVDSSQRQELRPRLSGFNVMYAHNGAARWDERLNVLARELVPGHIRWATGGNAYSSDWRTGMPDPDWLLRFEPDDNCNNNSNCSGAAQCLPQPTDAWLEFDNQCQIPCTETANCSSGEVCLFEQCAPSCVNSSGLADDTLCDPLRTCYRVDVGVHACVGAKVNKYISYRETLTGKGYQMVGDAARSAEILGADLAVHANAVTDSPDSIADLATSLLERGIDVRLWMLANEVFYFRSSGAPPTLWRHGSGYTASVAEYAAAIEGAYNTYNAGLAAAAQVPMPEVTISFSDAENAWQRVWDWGKDCMVGPIGTDCSSPPGSADNKPGIGDWIYDNGLPFAGGDFHWYPGNPTTSLEEARELIAWDLPQVLESSIDDFYLPLLCADQGGICADDEDPEITITEFNIQTTWHTALAAVHAAEFMMRASVQPRVSFVAYHSLLDGAMDLSDIRRQSAKTAAGFGRYGVFDSTATNADGSSGVVLGEYHGIPSLALQLVNPVVNTSTHTLATSLTGGATEMIAPDEDELEAAEAMESSVLHAQAYRGPEGRDFLLLTNRSDEQHEITISWDGAEPTAPLLVRSYGADSLYWANCGLNTIPIEDDSQCVPGGDLTLSEEQTSLGATITLSSWGVARVTLERAPAPTAPTTAPTGLVVTPGVRQAELSWSEVEDATGYEIRWGVTPGSHTRSQQVGATACAGGTCTASLSDLAHDIEHELVVIPVADGEPGPPTAVVTATPTRPELWDGSFQASIGNATWQESGGTVTADQAINLSFLPLGVEVDSDNDGIADAIDTPAWEAVSIEATFQANCSCAGFDNGGTCDFIGLVGRWQDSSNHIKALLYQNNEGCQFRIQRASSTLGNEVIGRSAFIGVPIRNANAPTPLNADGTPEFPEIPAIDDGQPHTLRLSMEDSVIRLWLDGRMVAAALDDTYSEGGAALMVRNQETTWQDISVWPGPW